MLKGNRGLELPSNIGELGESVTAIDLSGHNLRGASLGLTRHTARGRKFLVSRAAGELPLAIGRLKANGCKVNLFGNNGFTLSADISAVADATKLDFSSCYLGGVRSVQAYRARKSLSTALACTGSLPKELGSLTNLQYLNLDGNALEKPAGCPAGRMTYNGKDEVAAFLRCFV